MREFEGGHAAHDECNAKDSTPTERISVEGDPDGKGSRGADASPNGVGSAHGDLLLSEPEKQSADGHANDRHDHAQEFSLRGLGQFQSDRPSDFKQSSENEEDPRVVHECRRDTPQGCGPGRNGRRTLVSDSPVSSLVCFWRAVVEGEGFDLCLWTGGVAIGRLKDS